VYLPLGLSDRNTSFDDRGTDAQDEPVVRKKVIRDTVHGNAQNKSSSILSLFLDFIFLAS